MAKISMKLNEGKTIQQGFDEFIRHCKVKNYSKDTIKYYENVVHNFELFCTLDTELNKVNSELLDKYMLHLRKKNLADKTLKTYMGGMRTILYYFMEQGYIDHFKISMPKVDTPIKNVYTTGELERLLKKPDLKNCTFAEYRNWVLINYLIGTGQRLNSVIHIKIKDLDLANNLVALNTTKNRKHTILPLTSSLVTILNQYLKYRQGKDDDFLFCTENGGQMTRGCISCAVRYYNRNRGVDKTSIHMFRHSFAKNYLLNGGDVFRLQKLLCHSDIKVTKEYLDLSIEDIQQNYETVNPLENLVKNNSKIKMNR